MVGIKNFNGKMCNLHEKIVKYNKTGICYYYHMISDLHNFTFAKQNSNFLHDKYDEDKEELVTLTIDEIMNHKNQHFDKRIGGLIIPEKLSSIEIKFNGHTRYLLENVDDIYSMHLFTNIENYIPFGNALNINRIDDVQINCTTIAE